MYLAPNHNAPTPLLLTTRLDPSSHKTCHQLAEHTSPSRSGITASTADCKPDSTLTQSHAEYDMERPLRSTSIELQHTPQGLNVSGTSFALAVMDEQSTRSLDRVSSGSSSSDPSIKMDGDAQAISNTVPVPTVQSTRNRVVFAIQDPHVIETHSTDEYDRTPAAANFSNLLNKRADESDMEQADVDSANSTTACVHSSDYGEAWINVFRAKQQKRHLDARAKRRAALQQYAIRERTEVHRLRSQQRLSDTMGPAPTATLTRAASCSAQLLGPQSTGMGSSVTQTFGRGLGLGAASLSTSTIKERMPPREQHPPMPRSMSTSATLGSHCVAPSLSLDFATNRREARPPRVSSSPPSSSSSRTREPLPSHHQGRMTRSRGAASLSTSAVSDQLKRPSTAPSSPFRLSAAQHTSPTLFPSMGSAKKGMERGNRVTSFDTTTPPLPRRSLSPESTNTSGRLGQLERHGQIPCRQHHSRDLSQSPTQSSLNPLSSAEGSVSHCVSDGASPSTSRSKYLTHHGCGSFSALAQVFRERDTGVHSLTQCDSIVEDDVFVPVQPPPHKQPSSKREALHLNATTLKLLGTELHMLPLPDSTASSRRESAQSFVTVIDDDDDDDHDGAGADADASDSEDDSVCSEEYGRRTTGVDSLRRGHRSGDCESSGSGSFSGSCNSSGRPSHDANLTQICASDASDDGTSGSVTYQSSILLARKMYQRRGLVQRQAAVDSATNRPQNASATAERALSPRCSSASEQESLSHYFSGISIDVCFSDGDVDEDKDGLVGSGRASPNGRSSPLHHTGEDGKDAASLGSGTRSFSFSVDEPEVSVTHRQHRPSFGLASPPSNRRRRSSPMTRECTVVSPTSPSTSPVAPATPAMALAAIKGTDSTPTPTQATPTPRSHMGLPSVHVDVETPTPTNPPCGPRVADGAVVARPTLHEVHVTEHDWESDGHSTPIAVSSQGSGVHRRIPTVSEATDESDTGAAEVCTSKGSSSSTQDHATDRFADPATTALQKAGDASVPSVQAQAQAELTTRRCVSPTIHVCDTTTYPPSGIGEMNTISVEDSDSYAQSVPAPTSMLPTFQFSVDDE
eukprot:m.90681 g.90681  ORF g.90681 m.90681 type:complete len:1084 (-) comp12921_c0_seq1:147-3398(-)